MAPSSPALLLLASWLLVAVAGHYNPLVSVCPGEGGYCTVLYCTVLYCTVYGGRWVRRHNNAEYAV